ncbi:NAD-dependent deacylase [Brevibacillus agri]|nr:NAD-dependent deacylase [Brevibacillus agri]MED3501745.1 NAD-dependent deacylase [Brevibacillus agri]
MIAKWLKESRYTVIFSGAGMSTESGVPDFRSQSGLWHGKDPQSLASVEAMKYNQKEFIDFYRMRIQTLQNVKPHIGYRILSSWGQQFQVKSIITQNTDGLHEQAGNINVIPLHGTIQKLHCHSCGTMYSTDRYVENHLYCTCGGFIRPSVVLFGESLDPHMLAAAEKETKQSDLFIVLGSSLVVSPANSFPMIAKEHGARVVIINHDPTPLDSIADAVINNRNIGEVLRLITEELSLN